MKVIRRLVIVVFCLVSALTWWSCSSNQNTVVGSFYHNTTARFNGYFYAKEKVREVEKVILKSLDDDPNQILRLFPKLDTTLAKSYKKDTEEIIKMASISIQRHPNSRWLDDDYVLVGLARLYDCDFQNAIQTFKFVNTKSHDINLRHVALIHLIRTFTEQEEFAKAEEAFQFLEKEKLNKTNSKNLYLEKAYYYQVRADYDNMLRNLTKSDSLLTKADRKGRIYFIIGQVYQKLGFGSEAYNYYQRCLATNPDYEIDFYARLNMAQVARLDNSKNIRNIRKQFAKLLSDTKNQEFKDKIYFELGEFERKQGNIPEAIDQYKLSAHAGKNKRIQGNAYLRIGQLYFDSLKRFSLAKSFYDSAVTALPPEFENYVAIKKRHEVLGEFVKYTETIQWQDSLLMMAALDSSVLHSRIDSVFAAREKKEEGKKKKKKRSDNSGGNNQSSSFFLTESTSTTDWYFGNASAVSSGQGEFQRIWGTIPLEDNWRRSSRTATISSVVTNPNDVTSTNVSNDPKVIAPVVAGISPAKQAFTKILSELPVTDDQKKISYGMIEEAYFKLGDLYYFQLSEKDNAEDSYEKLLDRFPKSSFKPEVLYKLYLIHKERGDNKADVLAQNLKDEFPNSTYTKILLNPNYLKETSVAQEKQKIIYKEAYAEFEKNNLRGAQDKIKTARAVGETTFTPQLDLLQILITGKTEDVTRYQYELGEFIKKYEDQPIHLYAQTLLESSRTFLEKTERSKGIRFMASFDEPHYFVIVHRFPDNVSNIVSASLEKFNAEYFKSKKLETSNLLLNDQYALTFVSTITNQADALEYFNRFKSILSTAKPFSTLNFHSFVITKDNFNIFYRNKALDEYLSFFDRHYQKENQ
ncbi:MAG: tetratricopeptide repeat protein [Cyclobacteriaceae bacterium]|nr:tetratricopeptide repeat protein [Cyclobacteriaceae bacterium]